MKTRQTKNKLNYAKMCALLLSFFSIILSAYMLGGDIANSVPYDTSLKFLIGTTMFHIVLLIYASVEKRFIQ